MIRNTAVDPFASATRLLAAIRGHEVSATELVTLYRDRRDRLNNRVNAIVTPAYEQALQRARACDAGLGAAGALHGLPITIKDGIYAAGLPATGGMVEPSKAMAPDDALNVRRLREAGAVVLGKTNTPVGNADWQAVNPFFGRTNNPWNDALTPGGSTGGGAAAVAAGLTAAELGSDIGGSIRIPAAFCGIFGHKPSATALPRSGHFPWRNVANPAQLLGVQGPLARSAADLELLFRVLAGPDGLEAKGWRLELPAPRCERLAESRVGVLQVPTWIPVEQSILDARQAVCDSLASRGARVVEVRLAEVFDDFRRYYEQFLMLLQCILAAGLSPGARAKAAQKLRQYGDPFLEAIASGIEANAASMLELLEAAERYKLACEKVFAEIDVLLAPVCSVNAFPHDDSFFYDRTLAVDGTTMPYYRLSALPALATLAGLPATVFPTGRFATSGAPIGLQAIGAYLEDLTTIRFTQLVERELGGFTPPPGLG
jgi:amidase